MVIFYISFFISSMTIKQIAQNAHTYLQAAEIRHKTWAVYARTIAQPTTIFTRDQPGVNCGTNATQFVANQEIDIRG